jgi:hypothetical protein
LALVPSLAAAEPREETVEIREPRNTNTKVAQARPQRHQHAGARRVHVGHSHAHSRGSGGDAGYAHPSNEHTDHNGHTHQHGIETENLFGFTLGSDTEEAGTSGVAMEAAGRFGKRGGSYTGINKKLEFSYGVTNDLSVSLGLLADYHRIVGVTGLDDVRGLNFNGVGGEVRWRLARRSPNTFGVALLIEPSAQLHDELTGIRATKYGAENKLIFDSEIVKDRVFAALNLIYELERVRERGSPGWEESSRLGIAAAASFQVAPKAFVGGELRYLRAYEALVPRMFVGEAVYVGPTLFWHFAPNAWIAAAWNVQVAGHEAGNPARLDLTNFERHQARIKIGIALEPAPPPHVPR